MDTRGQKQITKTCNCCGDAHKEIPANARVNEMGSFWECKCGSTMFVADEALAEEMRLFRLNKKGEVA